MRGAKSRVLVTGGRDYANQRAVWGALFSLLLGPEGIDLVIHGGARGADLLAARWAKENSKPCLRVPAEWSLYGKAAGHRRNTRMLELGEPTLVVWFPGGRGTADMVKQALSSGIPVVEGERLWHES